jgi:DNA-directed RNA polymerase subunit L
VGDFSEDERVKLAEFRREYETMEIAKVYLKDARGEPYSYDFTIESVGPLSIPYMVRRACDVGESMMAKYTTVDSALPTDNKLHVLSSQSRVIGFDFVMKEQDHTFGNMLQTYLEQNHIYEGEEKAGGPVRITYVGYEVPHPLRDEMVIRIGCTSKTQALKAFAQGCTGCVRIFQQMREAWGRAVPEAGRELAKEVLAKGVKNAEAIQGARAALKSAFAPAETPSERLNEATAATTTVTTVPKPKKGLRRIASAV